MLVELIWCIYSILNFLDVGFMLLKDTLGGKYQLFINCYWLFKSRFPLVSGFYKLLSICMTVCGKTRYFDDLEESKVKADPQDSMEVDGGERKDLVQKEACFLLFTKFVKEVLIRLKQYKDDLLAACLQLILALPKEVVSAQMVAIVPALQVCTVQTLKSCFNQLVIYRPVDWLPDFLRLLELQNN